MKNQFKIAKIVNEYTFIITGGSSDGVNKDDSFRIIQNEDFEVVDPDTGLSLGSYTLNKGTIYVSSVYDNFSICRTEVTSEQVNTSFSAMSSIIGGTPKWIDVHTKLNVNEDEITGGLTPDPIAVGDIVKKIKS